VFNSLEVGFCLEALEEALARTLPQVLHSDKGRQYTSQKYIGCLAGAGVGISMSQRGCWDNILVECLWRRVKYEDLYLHNYEDGWALEAGLQRYFREYNEVVPHSALEGKRPGEVWRAGTVLIT
jgi:putative transposase